MLSALISPASTGSCGTVTLDAAVVLLEEALSPSAVSVLLSVVFPGVGRYGSWIFAPDLAVWASRSPTNS